MFGGEERGSWRGEREVQILLNVVWYKTTRKGKVKIAVTPSSKWFKVQNGISHFFLNNSSLSSPIHSSF